MHVDQGNIDALLSEYDNNLSKKVSSSNLFALLDATSLLWRLDITGVDVGEKRWSEVSDAVAHHVHNHRSPWLAPLDITAQSIQWFSFRFDTHIMMGLANGKVKHAAARLALAEGMMQVC
jgi:hypothetical protein